MAYGLWLMREAADYEIRQMWLFLTCYSFLAANSKIFFPAPWLDGTDLEQHPVNIWYWVREQSFKLPRSCLEIQLRSVQNKSVQGNIVFTCMMNSCKTRIQSSDDFSHWGLTWEPHNTIAGEL